MWLRIAPVRRPSSTCTRTVMPALEAARGDLDVVHVEAGDGQVVVHDLRRRALRRR